MTSQEILDFTTKAISDRHGEDTEAYNMRGISILADYYVLLVQVQTVNFTLLLTQLLMKLTKTTTLITASKVLETLTGF